MRVAVIGNKEWQNRRKIQDVLQNLKNNLALMLLL